MCPEPTVYPHTRYTDTLLLAYNHNNIKQGIYLGVKYYTK